MRKDIMVDIETLGTGEDASIFQIAGMSFDITNGETFDKINLIGDISKYSDMNVDGDTLKWWLNTNKELLTELLNKGVESEEDMFDKLVSWLHNQSATGDMKDVYLWGNGILFDNAKLQHNMTKNYLKYPIVYRNDRDVRTLVEVACMKSGLTEKELKDSVASENETKHDAMDDVKFQIRLAHKCYEIINSNFPTKDKYDFTKQTIDFSSESSLLIVRTDEILRNTGVTTSILEKAKALNATLIVSSQNQADLFYNNHGFYKDLLVISSVNSPNLKLKYINPNGFMVDDGVSLSVIQKLIKDGHKFLGGVTNIHAK